MAAKFKIDDAVPLARIFLSLSNFRDEPLETEPQAIERLCKREEVYPLAKDIVQHGLSPLERFALVPIGCHRGAPTYYVAEGNRRICAMKLLKDPELAPPQLRKLFTALADEWQPIRTVSGAIFPSMEEVRLWLGRIHNDAQRGIGRRSWNSEQKQRFDGGSKNKAAQALLDYAVSEGFMTDGQRRGKLTTAQRYLNNEVFREALGLEVNDAAGIGRTRPKPSSTSLQNGSFAIWSTARKSRRERTSWISSPTLDHSRRCRA